MTEKKAKKSEVLVLAERQRHALLVERVAAGKTLTHAEVRELTEYESQVPETPRPVAPNEVRRRRSKVSLPEVRALGLNCDNLTEAAAAFSGPGDLQELIESRDNVRAAWERGRLLRSVRQLGRTTISVPQAGKELGMTGLAFRQLLDEDREVRDLWDQQRRRLRVKMADAMVTQAEAGRPNALRYVENFLRSEKTPTGFDYEHVPISVMTDITGKTRQTLYAWTREAGLPRNPDCTYNLAQFVRWFEGACKAQAKTKSREDRLRTVHAKLKELDYQKERNALLDRRAVEKGLVARVQNFLAAVDNHVGPTASACVDQPVEAIEARIRQFCQRLRAALCEIPSELRLPAETAAEFERFLGRLEPPPDGEEEAGDA